MIGATTLAAGIFGMMARPAWAIATAVPAVLYDLALGV